MQRGLLAHHVSDGGGKVFLRADVTKGPFPCPYIVEGVYEGATREGRHAARPTRPARLRVIAVRALFGWTCHESRKAALSECRQARKSFSFGCTKGAFPSVYGMRGIHKHLRGAWGVKYYVYI